MKSFEGLGSGWRGKDLFMDRGSARPPLVFVFHASGELNLAAELKTQLISLERQEIVRVSLCSDIPAGTNIRAALLEFLRSAEVVVVCLSATWQRDYLPVFIESGILARQIGGEAWIVPVLFRAVDITGTPFESMSMLPSNGAAVARAGRATMWLEVVAAVREQANRFSHLPKNLSNPRRWANPIAILAVAALGATALLTNPGGKGIQPTPSPSQFPVLKWAPQLAQPNGDVTAIASAAIPPSTAVARHVAITKVGDEFVKTGRVTARPVASVCGVAMGLPGEGWEIGGFLHRSGYGARYAGAGEVDPEGRWCIDTVHLRDKTVLHQSHVVFHAEVFRKTGNWVPEETAWDSEDHGPGFVDITVLPPAVTLRSACGEPIDSVLHLPACTPFSLSGGAEGVYGPEEEKICAEVVSSTGSSGSMVTVLYGVALGNRWTATTRNGGGLLPGERYSARFSLVPAAFDGEYCGEEKVPLDWGRSARGDENASDRADSKTKR